MANNGYIPPVINSSSYITDPLMKKVAKSFEDAKHVQLYYDQFMGPALAEKHKDLVQALFGLKITPEQAAKGHQKALVAGK